jgi:hypothetical protein
MKFIIRFFLPLCLLSACTRTNQQNTTPPDGAAAVLDSAFFYSTGPKEIIFVTTNFHYDDKGRYTGTFETMTDSTVDHIGLVPDTMTLTLTYNGSDSLPATYEYTDAMSYYAGGPPGSSLLSYDDQRRIILDSPVNPIYNSLFIYGNSFISRTAREFVATQDTIFTDGDNVSRYKVGSGEYLYSFIYSNYPNPWYFPRLAAHAGLLFYDDARDTYSKNLFSKKVAGGTYFPTARTYNYSWTLNSAGQVISGIGTDQRTGEPVEYYRFVYKK